MLKRLAILLFLASPAAADSIAVGNLRGLNNGDASILINDSEAQDLSNVDITDNGYGVKKRDGTATFKTIGTSTWGVRGGYYFTDISSNKLLVHANNRSVYTSLNGGNYSAFITTDTAGSYYDFTDSQGVLYRVNSNRDEVASYNGSALTYYPSAPKGDQIESMADRMAISGTSASPNTVYFSALADFTNFTTGIDEADPFTEDFTLPGQKINAIKYALGRLLVWTRTTTQFWAGTNQFDGIIQDVSTTVGCDQPSSVIFDQGIVYWQAQNHHFYGYDGNVITKISNAISGSVNDMSGGESKSWLQSSQLDFQSGTASQVSTSISPGNVVLSTWTDSDTLADDFAGGTLTNVSTTSAGTVRLSTNSGNHDNYSFETTQSSGIFIVPTEWITMGGGTWVSGFIGFDGSNSAGASEAAGLFQYKVILYDTSFNKLSQSSLITHPGSNTAWTQKTFTSSGAVTGQAVYLGFDYESTVLGPIVLRSSTPFIFNGEAFTYYEKFIQLGSPTFGKELLIDLVQNGRTTIGNGNIVSGTFDTALSTPIYSSSTASWTTNGHIISAKTQTSNDGSTWDSAVSWSTGTAPTSTHKRYIRYEMDFTTASTGVGLPFVSDVTLNARSSTGTFTSQAKEIGTAITSWGNFYADDTPDSGTIGYFIRTSSTSGGLASASWTALTSGAQITASTAAFAQVKATFTITNGDYDPTLEDFSLNWNEGLVTHTWGTVDKNHRLMWSVAENASAVPNVTYIYDPRFQSWLKYSIPFDAPAHAGDSIYYGGPSTGVVYLWPSGTNDSGDAFTAYWKSKDYIGGDPFVEKDWLRYSVLAKSETGSNLDIVYSTNTVGSVTNNFSLTDSNGVAFKRINALLKTGTAGSFMSMKFGNDDADAPFEVYTFRLDYTPRPWRVMP